MWRSGLQKFSSYEPRTSKQETTRLLPYLVDTYVCSSMNYFWIFFSTPVYVWKFWNVIPLLPPSFYIYNTHSKLLLFGVAADTPALDVTCFKKWQLSNTDYLRITNNQNLSTFHVCTAAASITALAVLADALVKHQYVTDWMQCKWPNLLRVENLFWLYEM